MTSLIIPAENGITLKTWEVSSAPALFALVDENRAELGQWLPWVPFVQKEADSEKFIRDSQAEWERQASLELGIWHDQTLVGCIGLHELNRLHKKTSIGYWLGKQHQGKGIMTEAVRALTTWCLTEQDFHRVEIRAATENTKSRALPTRLGFVEEGVIRQAELVAGKYLDSVVYGMLQQDWPSA